MLTRTLAARGLLLVIVSWFAGADVSPAQLAADRHIVVVVWDGMRPDFMTEQSTPTLWKLAQRGVTFRNHHAVYISATNVNGTALATGDYPAHDGIIANHEFRPKIDSQKSLDVELPDTVAKGDALSGGKYVAVPTVAELVRQAGGRTITAAAKTVGFLQDRHPDVAPPSEPMSRTHRQDADAATGGSVTLSAGRAWPNDVLNSIVMAFGPFPKSHADRDRWTANALTEFFWKNGLPPFSALWLGEPDLTQHETAPGAPEATRAIKSSDDNLAKVLSTLDRLRIADRTDVFVVSDHGFSTIEHEIDLRKILRDAGFNVVTEFKGPPTADEIMMVGVGGSVLFYLPQHDAGLGQRLTEFLQQTDYAGVIFSNQKLAGTFSLDQAKIDSVDAPDIVMAFRWNDAKNQFGVPGMIDADWQRTAGKGTHATLSRFDMHNTLIAAGPDFRKGWADDLPTGNIDLAPTMLHILGVPGPHMDGRVLSEALTNPTESKADTQTMEATRKLSSGFWRQNLQISRVGATVYLDQGNGSYERNRP